MAPIDLRSDTVTRPTRAMRAAMLEAEVGDDVYGEDPSVRALEARVAELFGKESALFMCSGTMSNQVALLLHTRPGDEVVIGEGSHCAWFESGAAAAWAGVQFAVAGQGGFFSPEELRSAVKPPHYYYPRTSLVVIENTHNRSGGRVLAPEAQQRLVAEAKALGLATHLDGARIWNAHVALGASLAALAAPFDTISVCFSKGLGAPVGSALLGSREHMLRARRLRKMLGGGLRQAGILAAGALYALEHHLPALAHDHEHARKFAAIVKQVSGLKVLPEPLATNIVIIELQRPIADEAIQQAASAGVLLSPFGPSTLRAVTHLDVTLEQVQSAAERVAQVLSSLLRN